MQRHPDLIVFSHLRWDFVWQRPQHLLTRLAADRRVLFIEEPVRHDGATPSWERHSPEPGVTVYRPRTPSAAPGFHDDQMAHLRPLIEQLREQEALGDYLVWFYTPMALPLLDALNPLTVVYDCMDELSAFRGAPPQMLEREAELLRRADVVFTGGPSLYRAKKDRHPNVHCFPSSVDLAHFGKAREGLAEHPEQSPLPHPRLGFFGVIDERLDVPLLGALAQTRPDWQLVLVGPVVKIDPADLPRQPNIHYFGQRTYQELPAFLTGWDVCLLPFARNEATRFISPTKTLEYMAAEKPIVSTPIADVAGPYGDIVYLAETPEEFVAACERALGCPEEERAARIEKKRAVLSRTSWDATARAMSKLLEQAASRRSREPARAAQAVRRRWSWSAPAPPASAPPTTWGKRPCCWSRTTASAAGAAPSRRTALRSTSPATSCSPTTPTSTRCTGSYWGTTSTGRIARPGSTARGSTRATPSRAPCTACPRTSSRSASSAPLRRVSDRSRSPRTTPPSFRA
jgi:UDP-galactopyranose mutase